MSGRVAAMKFKALFVDLNGTLIDILTDEGYADAYRMISNLLDYQGVGIAPDELRRLFFEIAKRQKRDSGEPHPEFDVVAIFSEIIERFGGDRTRALPPDKLRWLPVFLAEAYRSAIRFKLALYPDVKAVMDKLSVRYRMATISDGQGVWARPELASAGLAEYFETVVVSGDYGYRKPDKRIFETALSRMNLRPEEVVFVGNDMYRDIWGAHEMGMKTVFFRSNQGDWRSRGAEPDYIIYNFRELPAAIEFLEKNTPDIADR